MKINNIKNIFLNFKYDLHLESYSNCIRNAMVGMTIFLFFNSSCRNTDSEKSKIITNVPNTINKITIPKKEICEYDSIIIEEGKTFQKLMLKIKRIRILNNNAIRIIKPYLRDSISNEYGCCLDTIIGNLKVFSSGKICDEFRIVPPGGPVELDRNYDNITLVPHGYQFRIYIPINEWKRILRNTKKVRIK